MSKPKVRVLKTPLTMSAGELEFEREKEQRRIQERLFAAFPELITALGVHSANPFKGSNLYDEVFNIPKQILKCLETARGLTSRMLEELEGEA